MLHAHGLAGEAGNFHYHVEPTLGFYCLYRERPGEALLALAGSLDRDDRPDSHAPVRGSLGPWSGW